MIGRLKRVAASDLLLRRTAFSESMRRHVESNSDKLSAANFYIANKNKRHERNIFKYSRRNVDPKQF